MPQKIACPGCQASLQIRADLAGKKVKCPKCGNSILIPKPPEEEEFVEVEAIDEVDEVDEVEEVEDAPRRKKDRRQDEKGPSRWAPCPFCGAQRARKVLWTFWGSFYGPALFSHVECRECGARYNGRTGGSNLIPAILCFSVPLLLIAGLIGFILYMIWDRIF